MFLCSFDILSSASQDGFDCFMLVFNTVQSWCCLSLLTTVPCDMLVAMAEKIFNISLLNGTVMLSIAVSCDCCYDDNVDLCASYSTRSFYSLSINVYKL